MSTALELPQSMQHDAPSLVEWARGLTIATSEQFTDAGERLQGIKALQKEIADHFGPMKTKTHAAWKEICAKEREMLDPLFEAESLTKKAIGTYQSEQEKARREEQRRLQAEADERARRDREALEAKAAKAKKPETQQKYAEAAQAVVAPVVRVEPTLPKVASIQTREVWTYEVHNEALVPSEFRQIDHKKLASYARAMKQSANVPGVRFFTEQQIASKGR